MKAKSHKFLLEVEAPVTRKHAELAVLHAFSSRQPDGCVFKLKKKKPSIKKYVKKEPSNVCEYCGQFLTDHSEKLCSQY